MKKNKIKDFGAYVFGLDKKHFLRFIWDEEKDYIRIEYVYYNNPNTYTFAERSYKKSTLAEMRNVFEYLVDYYRTYRKR